MVEIITEKVDMPPLVERRYQKTPNDSNGNKWTVTDTKHEKIRYVGKYEGASLVCHNLNKKHYQMSRRLKFEPKMYKHQETIDKLDEFMIAVKCISLVPNEKLTEEQITKLKKGHPMPSIREMDMLHQKIREVLCEDYELLIKR